MPYMDNDRDSTDVGDGWGVGSPLESGVSPAHIGPRNACPRAAPETTPLWRLFLINLTLSLSLSLAVPGPSLRVSLSHTLSRRLALAGSESPGPGGAPCVTAAVTRQQPAAQQGLHPLLALSTCSLTSQSERG